MVPSLRSSFLLSIVLLFAASVLAQTSRGTISGTVYDQSGAIVTDATVKADQAQYWYLRRTGQHECRPLLLHRTCLPASIPLQ